MAERMRERAVFQYLAPAANVGGVVKGYPASYAFGPVAARFTPLRGGEEVIAGRVAGKQAYFVKVRSSSATRQVTTSDQIVDAHDATRVMNIRSIQNPDERDAYLVFTAELGVIGG